MNLVFYTSNDDPTKMGKNLGNPVHTAGGIVAYEPVDDLNGVFKVSYNFAIDNANYCIYGDRKYFITDRTFGTAGMIIISVTIDVLDTYQMTIENLDCIISRTSADPKDFDNIGWNSLLNDPMGVLQVNTEEFEVGLSGDSDFFYTDKVYLACIGCDSVTQGDLADKIGDYRIFP